MSKKFILFQVIILCMSSVFSTIQADPSDYQQENGEERFNAIKETVIDSTKSIANYGADEAYDLIKKSLVKFKNLHKKVKEAKYVDDVIDEVTNSLDEIATTYEKVASLKTEILQFRSEETSNLRDAKGGTDKTVKELAIEKKEVVSQTNSFKEKLLHTNDDFEKQKIKISIKGNESIINSFEAQEQIWRKFHTAQEKLIVRLNLNGKKIDLLLHVVETNAAVYREAANVAKLRRSAKAALKNLQSLSDMQSILGDLQNSWIEVNDLVSEISNVDFNVELP